MEPPRWKIITPSQKEWERRGLDFIRSGLPNHDPYLAWANSEFQAADGAIYEVQLLVLTKQGFGLVEIKDWPGRVGGDAGTWTRTKDGQTCSEDKPVLLAERPDLAAEVATGRQESPGAIARCGRRTDRRPAPRGRASDPQPRRHGEPDVFGMPSAGNRRRCLHVEV